MVFVICNDIFFVSFHLWCSDDWGKTIAAFLVRNAMYVPVRLAAIVASVLTFYFSLAKETQGLDVAAGNFNIKLVRVGCLLAVGFLQVGLLFSYSF